MSGTARAATAKTQEPAGQVLQPPKTQEQKS
jgi:hypothetical protein